MDVNAEKVDRDVRAILDSPLIQSIRRECQPDERKLELAVRLVVAQTISEDLRETWDDPDAGTITEKVALAAAAGVPFRRAWPRTYAAVSAMLRDPKAGSGNAV